MLSEMLHSAIALTLHHRRDFVRDLCFPYRLANSTNIPITHGRCLVAQQVPQDVRSNARSSGGGHYGAAQIMQFHVLKTGFCDKLAEKTDGLSCVPGVVIFGQGWR